MSSDGTRWRWHPATLLAALPLGVITCGLLPGWALPLALALLAWGLRRGGLSMAAQAAALRPWRWVGLLVLVVHTFTTASAAPLGQPSWPGVGRGVVALSRVAAMAGCLMLARRALRLNDLLAGLAWWTWPFWRRAGQSVPLALSVVVAVGVVPGVVSEGRRLAAAVKLRRGDSLPKSRLRRWGVALLDHAHLLLPLLESMFRRAETLPLAMQGRLPRLITSVRPPLWQLGGLLAWTTLLVMAVVS